MIMKVKEWVKMIKLELHNILLGTTAPAIIINSIKFWNDKRKVELPNDTKLVIITTPSISPNVFFELYHNTLYIVSVPQWAKDAISKPRKTKISLTTIKQSMEMIIIS